jgi:sugar lactone lactonase YvrE
MAHVLIIHWRNRHAEHNMVPVPNNSFVSNTESYTMKTLSPLIAATSLWALAASAQSAPFPDPQASAPREIAASSVIAEYPVGTFLENLVVEGDHVIATDYVAKALYRINKTTGDRTTIASLPNHAPGVASYRGGYLLSGSTAEGQPAVLQVDSKGQVRKLVDLPKGGFINGIAPFAGDRFLVADSGAGAIYLVDVALKTVATWLQDPILTSDGKFQPFIPGANGVRRKGDYVYIASMQKSLLLRVRISKDGAAGKIQTVANNVFIDDFAVAKDGTVYATTHIFDSVLRIRPNGRVTIIATREQGLLGPTSAYFGPEGNGNQVLYVTNNGQLYIQPEGGPGTGRLVRIDLRGKAGGQP